MKHSTPEERELATEQVAGYATKAGTPAWRDSVARSLRNGDLDRWAREVLRALGWPQPLPGARVYRRYQEDPANPDPKVPFLPRGPDEYKLDRLYEVEVGASPAAEYRVHVRKLTADNHAYAAAHAALALHWGGDVGPYLWIETAPLEEARRVHP